MIVRTFMPLLLALLLLQACDFGGNTGGGTGAEGLTGSLVDAKGAPVADATVRLYAEPAAPLAKAAQASLPVDSTVTKADGSFRFAKLPSGRYNLEASARRADTVLATFARGIAYAGILQRGKDTLRVAGELRIRVLAAGQPVAGAHCFIAASPYASHSDTSGTCKLTGVAPGLYEAGVSHPGESPVYTDTLEVKPGATTEATSILGAPGSTASSGRGVAWTAKASGTTATLSGINWSENQFTAVGNSGTVVLSSNASDWTVGSTGMSTNLGRVVIRTSAGLLCTAAEGAVFSSPTGVAWTRVASGGIGSMAWDGGTLILVSGGGFIRTASADGTGWATVASGADPANPGITPDFLQVTWTGNQFVAVGRTASDSAAVIYTSPNGSGSWTLRYLGAPATPLTYVVQAGNKLYAGSPEGRLLTSVDGHTWTEAPTAPPLRTLRWTGDRLVGVGQGTDNTAGIWTSTDGSHWKRRFTGAPGSFLQSVAVSDSVIVAVGSNGLILTSP